jgi:hypothetical protein
VVDVVSERRALDFTGFPELESRYRSALAQLQKAEELRQRSSFILAEAVENIRRIRSELERARGEWSRPVEECGGAIGE